MLQAPWSHGPAEDLAFTMYAAEIEEQNQLKSLAEQYEPEEILDNIAWDIICWHNSGRHIKKSTLDIACDANGVIASDLTPSQKQQIADIVYKQLHIRLDI